MKLCGLQLHGLRNLYIYLFSIIVWLNFALVKDIFFDENWMEKPVHFVEVLSDASWIDTFSYFRQLLLTISIIGLILVYTMAQFEQYMAAMLDCLNDYCDSLQKDQAYSNLLRDLDNEMAQAVPHLHLANNKFKKLAFFQLVEKIDKRIRKQHEKKLGNLTKSKIRDWETAWRQQLAARSRQRKDDLLTFRPTYLRPFASYCEILHVMHQAKLLVAGNVIMVLASAILVRFIPIPIPNLIWGCILSYVGAVYWLYKAAKACIQKDVTYKFNMARETRKRKPLHAEDEEKYARLHKLWMSIRDGGEQLHWSSW